MTEKEFRKIAEEKAGNIAEIMERPVTREELITLSYVGVALGNLVPTLLRPNEVVKFFTILLGLLRTGDIGDIGVEAELEETLQGTTKEILFHCTKAYGGLAIRNMCEEGYISEAERDDILGELGSEPTFVTND